ncbi:MAG TPA: phosphatase PAP2 family protein [Gemmatimonadaceae bacterium]|nr:phosphatase PAP2 family protein [Gemmatimonadaceae bacterium]
MVCYLAAGTALLVLGRDRVYAGGFVVHLAVLAAMSVATFTRRVPAWLTAWAPLIALLFLYTELPMLIRAAGHGQFYDMTVMSWETRVFDGQPAFQWAMSMPSRLLSETLHAAYLSYYAIIFSVPAALWLGNRRREFSEAVFVLMLTFVACFICFIAFPVEGPRYLREGSAPAGPLRQLTLSLLEARSSRGTAFPSSHVAVATTQSLLACWYFGRRGVVVGIFALGLALGAVYGGFHYAIDVIVGAVLGALLMPAGLALSRLMDRSSGQANATAPTNPLPAAEYGSSTSSSGTAST